MLSMSSGIGFRSLFSSKSASSGANTLIDVLDNAQAALKESKDLLNLAPVSGLSTAVGVLLAIIDQVKKMKSNAETVEAVAKEMKELNDIISQVIRRVGDRAARLRMRRDEREKMWEDLQASDGWQERIEQLVRDLRDVLAKAEPCAEGPWYKRLFRSTRDEETLKTVREDITRIHQRYQLAGTLSIEALTEQHLAQLEAVYMEVKRISAAQQAEHERKIVEAIPHADAAGYKAASNSDKSSYLPGTRAAVWKRLEEWKASTKPVCFLIGAAGMGKSTLASEFCRRHADELGASFFFRRGDPSVGSTTLFFSTIVYQLAQSRPDLRAYIAGAAEKHMPAGRSQQMRYTVAELLQKPLHEAAGAGVLPRVYVVVDALDECTESLAQPDLVPDCLRLLLCWALEHPSSLRILITSRPDPDYVGRALRSDPQDTAMTDSSVLLSLYDVEDRQDLDNDIRAVISARLNVVKEGAQWHKCDPTVATRLMKQSQGLFIYARTAVDFIVRSPGIAQMEHRLQLLLTPGNTYGLANLDVLYRTVLETAFPPEDLDPVTRDQVIVILAWIALCPVAGGIEPVVVEELSGISCRISLPILTKLRSVLDFDPGAPDVETTVFCAMHVTFRDFLVDSMRCRDVYHVHSGRMHARFAGGCLTWMHDRTLRRRTPHQVEWYCSQYWLSHIVEASPTEELVSQLARSVTMVRPSLFFYHRPGILRDASGLTKLLFWVGSHVGPDLARSIAEQFRQARLRMNIHVDEEIVIPDFSPRSPTPPPPPPPPKKRKVKELHPVPIFGLV